MKQYTTLLFDADNTLLDFDRTEYLAFVQSMSAFDLPISPTNFALYQAINHELWSDYEKGKVSRDFVVIERFKRFFNCLGIKLDAEQFEKFYQNNLANGAFCIPGAKALLSVLRPHFHLYIITNGVATTQRRRLETTELYTYLDGIFISEEIGAQKPDKAFFDIVIQKIGHVHPNECLIIGDSLSSDIAGGEYAGIDTCWYNPKKQSKSTSSIIPSYCITSLSELYPLLGFQNFPTV